MTSLQEVLDRVLRYMVANQVNGVFIGTPRDTAEEVAVSSGPMYRALYAMGLTREGQGRNARWTIPQNIIDRYSS
jgi:hypothetical protein